MSATTTPGVSHGTPVGNFANNYPVTLAAGATVPKGLWWATGAGLVGTGVTAPFTWVPPAGGSGIPGVLVASDGTVVAGVAMTLYRFIFG